MKAVVLLADSAQTDSTGKVHALGLGWSATSSPTAPMAIVVFIEVDWAESNVTRQAKISLLRADGQVVEIPGPLGPQEVSIEASFEVGRPAGVPKGSPLNVPLTVNVPAGLVLESGQRYEWRVTVDGYENSWSVGFLVR